MASLVRMQPALTNPPSPFPHAAKTSSDLSRQIKKNLTSKEEAAGRPFEGAGKIEEKITYRHNNWRFSTQLHRSVIGIATFASKEKSTLKDLDGHKVSCSGRFTGSKCFRCQFRREERIKREQLLPFSLEGLAGQPEEHQRDRGHLLR